jgi:hypothetical protein
MVPLILLAFWPTYFGNASATAASVGRLLDRPSPPLRLGTDPQTDELLEAYRKTQASFWPILER